MVGNNDYLVVYLHDGKEWRWKRKAANHLVVSNSSEGYVNFNHALSMAKDLNPGLPVFDNKGKPILINGD